MSKSVQPIIDRAIALAQEVKSEYVTLEHTAQALLEDQFGQDVAALGVDVPNAIQELVQYNKIQTSGRGGKPQKTYTMDRVFNRAIMQVLFQGRKTPEQYDIAISIILEGEQKSFASYIFAKYGITRDLIRNLSEKPSSENTNNMLEEYCENLTEMAAQGKLQNVIGRDDVVFELCQILGRKNKPNALLVGDPGVGKTAIAEGLAVMIHEDRVPDHLKDAEIWNLEIGTLLAGSRYRGDFEEKIRHVVDALKQRPNAVLFVDEAHSMRGAGAGTGQGPDFANMIKPAIARGEIRIIASTTWEEFRQSFEKDRALMRRFQHVTLDEPTAEQTIEILKGIRSNFEEFYSAKVDDSAIEAAVKYSIRYLTDRKLPDKAIDLIDMSFARHKTMNHVNYSVTEKDVLLQLSQITSIPADELTIDEKSTSMDVLEDKIRMNLFGQNQVVDPVLETILVAKAGLKDPNRPIGSFLFLGPTGVGKTELAKLLADGLNMKLHKFSMSEYQEKHSISRLIGAPPGYVGYSDGGAGDGGLLIQALKKNPHSVILFDEFEKAHPDVLQLFLELLDEGKITGANGTEVNARNTVIIFTSNLGAEAATKRNIGFKSGIGGTDAIQTELEKFVPPEFRNRLDGTYTFKGLSDDALKMIAAKFLNEIRDLTRDRGIELNFTDAAIQAIINKGYNPAMGARPLHRLIRTDIKVPLARKLVQEGLKNTTVTIDFDKDFIFDTDKEKIGSIGNSSETGIKDPEDSTA